MSSYSLSVEYNASFLSFLWNTRFFSSYAILAADAAEKGKNLKESSQKILDALITMNALKPEEFQTGLEKASAFFCSLLYFNADFNISVPASCQRCESQVEYISALTFRVVS